MNLDHVLVSREADFVTITMNRPQRRNALSLSHLRDLITAFDAAGESDASGIILAGAGPVFSAGHDFAHVAEADEAAVRTLLDACLQLMELIESVPQPVIARVHALATAAGCQLVAACDLAIAADSAGFAAPGGKGGWFCHTPMVAIGRKRAAELAYTGDTITAAQALEWGLLNRVVPADDLDSAVADLLSRATRGSRASKALGKRP
ncbi:enoyl-CoA hydratase-related protein [Nonomuraea sp. NPDC050790]|uniref:enoyl-CoA hydratase-related protein n=1 Tax=Nonomuraea sp. NPDC050790 TaxID=3364371 RepID=UPI0037B207A5